MKVRPEVVLRLEDLRVALLEGDSPATPAEVKRRVEDFVNGLTKRPNPSKVRIVLE